MPVYEVEISGKTYEVDAPDEQSLTLAVKQMTSGGNPAATGQQDGSFSLDNASRAVSRGALGVGSYLDELDAATNATLAPMVDPLLPDSFQKLPGQTWQERYDRALDIQRGKDKAFDAEHPAASTGLQIAGGVGSAGAVLKAAPIAGEYLLGNTGATLPARVLSTGVAGLGTGAVQGFGAGEGGLRERSLQAGKEAAVGGATGIAMMPMAAAANAGARKVAQALLGKTDDALSSMTSEGRKYLTRELADPQKIAGQQERLAELGPEATLADVSPDWLGVARGAAARPGTRGMIVDPLTDRANLANARLRSDVEENLGPDPVPSAISNEIDANLAEVGKQYRPVFREKQMFDFQPIRDDLDVSVKRLRGDAQKRLQQVRSMLNDYGKDTVTNDPSVAFETRQAIDGMLKTEADPKAIIALQDARQMIDDALTRSVPRIKEVDAGYSELSRQQEALDMGRPILNNEAQAMRPVELQEKLTQGALPQGMSVGPSGVPTRMKQGTLGEIYRAIGTKANDTTALRNIVRGEGDWNREKLTMLFGDGNADRALNAIDRETVFGDTANRVTRGSDTAMGNRFSKFLDDISKAQEVPNDVTMTGASLRVLRALARGVTHSNAAASADHVAEDIGRLSVAKGVDRDMIVQALMRRGKENVVDQQRQAVLNALLQGAGQSGYASLPFVRN